MHTSYYIIVYIHYLSIYIITYILLHYYLYITLYIIAHWVECWPNGPGDLSSISGQVIPKTLKMVLDISLLNTQQYKVSIKCKV